MSMVSEILLAEISQNIKALQLQLDYERAKIITALGGEPALYDVTGTGELTATTASIGGGSNIAGAVMQVDGSLVIGDGSGGTKAKLSATENIIPAQTSLSANIADDAMTTFTPGRTGGVIMVSDVTGTTPGKCLMAIYNLSNNYCREFLQTGTLWEFGDNLDLTTLSNTTDGKIKISAYSGTIQVRNRLGNTVYLGISILGARN